MMHGDGIVWTPMFRDSRRLQGGIIASSAAFLSAQHDSQ